MASPAQCVDVSVLFTLRDGKLYSTVLAKVVEQNPRGKAMYSLAVARKTWAGI